MVRAVLTGRSVVSGFDLVCFSSLSFKHLCIFSLHDAVYISFIATFFTALLSELSLVGLALALVDLS